MDAAPESFPINKDSGERRQNTGNGCRLFGIQLVDNSNLEDTLPVGAATGASGDTQQIPSLDAESEHSEPSNVNRVDHPSVSCDAEKSSLRSPQELQSRQIRSCTKVVIDIISHLSLICVCLCFCSSSFFVFFGCFIFFCHCYACLFLFSPPVLM